MTRSDQDTTSSQASALGDKRHPQRETLKTRWKQWTAIIRLFALRADKRHALSEDNYNALHATLCQLCPAAEEDGTGAKAADATPLRKLIAPWSTLQSLERANRALIDQLYDHCLEARDLIDGSHATRIRKRTALELAAGVIVLALAAGAGICATSSSSGSWSVARMVRQWFDDVQQAIFSLGYGVESLLAAGVATLVAMMIVCRATGRG